MSREAKPRATPAIERFPVPKDSWSIVKGDLPEFDRDAAAYLALSAQKKELEKMIEPIAERLRITIGTGEGLETDNFQVGWPARVGNVDWAKLAEDEEIPPETIECYRKAPTRSLDVRAKAKDGAK